MNPGDLINRALEVVLAVGAFVVVCRGIVSSGRRAPDNSPVQVVSFPETKP
jgi:hypothetical protein